MKVYDLEDTIAAIATPFGEGGIGIIRISGPDALKTAQKIFHAKKSIDQIEPHRLYYGEIIDPTDKKGIDEVMISYMKAPKSFTKEDVVEINSHGGSVVLKWIMEILFREGIREAGPGEFSKRAFLNGRIDLSQAEAIIDIIRAKTEQGLRMAHRQLEGGLSERLACVKENLVDVLAILEAYTDFPEDDIEEQIFTDINEKMLLSSNHINELLATYEEGRITREGIHVVIAGRPNVGKSSLLNVLLKEKRAIVTSTPGTTRDVIEEIVNIKGIPVNLIDTAGIRETEDLVEGEGIRLAKERLKGADFVLYMVDEEGAKEEDIKAISEVDVDCLVVVNKMDLIPEKVKEEIKKALTDIPFTFISTLEGTDLEGLKEKIYDNLMHHGVGEGPSVAISRKRHKIALEKSKAALERGEKGLKDSLSYEFVAQDLRESLDAIRELVGETTTEDILDRIFSEFCIGK